jgi:cell envelope opacity-associated protein A
MTAAAAAAAAGAVFLGVEQKKELQRKRENNETISREGVTMTTTSVAAKTTTTTTRPVIDTTGFLSMATPHFQHDLYNNIHDVRTATNNSFRSLTFSDLIAKVNTISNNNNNTTSMEPLQRKTASAKNKLSPSRIHQPRNVMISRMRSVAGRGLHDKYNVDWKTVLGEGAYGSVHPARLALTGEKVSLI